ncbi:hypothetical protein HUO13_18375 [Saccharopolyspora erythraea]|uniref:hypothetical protein n=1 Tax=Saccharopolyspora erythraea TaxID=1836 RepID=UPI001BA74766|nr:hypothetical protein [Saccharopolyspora erythraea]QUG99389.1 hypothetical protein HUO13_18375 [Saccharopolyspora erythraea]
MGAQRVRAEQSVRVIAGAAPPWARRFRLPEPPLTRPLMAEKRILTFEAPG